MEKVAFTVTKLGKETNTKIASGVGYLVDNTLLTPQVSNKSGKPYIRDFALTGFSQTDDGSYSCLRTEYREYEGREYPVTYRIWFKKVEAWPLLFYTFLSILRSLLRSIK